MVKKSASRLWLHFVCNRSLLQHRESGVKLYEESMATYYASTVVRSGDDAGTLGLW